MMKERSKVMMALSLLTIVLLSGCIELQKSDDDPWWTVDLGTDDGLVEVNCEPALTEEQRRTGLMNRDHLGEFEGMIFVFEPSQNVSIWMKDTKVPLDVIFVAPSGAIASIVELPPGWGLPEEEVPYCTSPIPVSYVIEVNRGFCSTHGVRIGAYVTVHEKA